MGGISSALVPPTRLLNRWESYARFVVVTLVVGSSCSRARVSTVQSVAAARPVDGEQRCWRFQSRPVIASGQVLCANKFALLGLMWVRARKSSPCVLTMAKSWRLMARWASIFAEMPLERPRWASIFADQQSWDPAGRVCCAVCLAAEPIYWQC